MNENENLIQELANVYESLLHDINCRIKEKVVVLKEIADLHEAADKLEERLGELTYTDEDV